MNLIQDAFQRLQLQDDGTVLPLPASIDHLMLQQQEKQESQYDVESTADLKKNQVSSTQMKFSGNPFARNGAEIPDCPVGLVPSVLSFNEVPRFELHAQLGVGGSAQVHLGFDVDVQRKIAIKEFWGRKDPRELCQQELRVLGLIDHPGVPTVFDVCKGVNEQGQERFWYSMRYVQGQTLKQIIKKLVDGDVETHQRFSFVVRAEIIRQLLRILEVSHTAGVVHRDIKPENIIIGACGEVTLIDWGIAVVLQEDNGKGELIGSPAYMAPEQAGRQGVDFSSDLFSLGTVFYELMSLRRRVDISARNIFAMISAVRDHIAPPVDELPHPHQSYVPSEFRAIIDKSTANAKAIRYQTAAEMRVDLERAFEGEFCVICPRTRIKRALHVYMNWLDWNPRKALFISATVLMLFVVCVAMLGMVLGMVM